jgi:hypothetical protein
MEMMKALNVEAIIALLITKPLRSDILIKHLTFAVQFCENILQTLNVITIYQ